MTIVEILNIIKEIALSTPTCNSAFVGDVYNNWNTTNCKFASVNVALQSIDSDIEDGNVTYNIILYYGDRLEQDNRNVTRVQSDGFVTLQSIINDLNKIDGFTIEGTINYTPFEQQFVDYLGGVYCTVNLYTNSPIGGCSIEDMDE